MIGKYFRSADVGFFTRANSIQQLPVLLFTNIIQQVTLPTFSKIQDDEYSLKQGYKRAIQLSAFTILLPLSLIVVSSEPLVLFLLTDKWLPSASMLKILAIGGIFYPLNALNVNIIGIKGRSDYLMYLQFLKDSLILIGVAIGLIFGINGLVISYTVTIILAYGLNVYFANKVINFPAYEQLMDIIPFFIISVLSGLLSLMVGKLGTSLFSTLILIWLTGTLTYGLLSYIFNLSVIQDFKILITDLLRK